VEGRGVKSRRPVSSGAASMTYCVIPRRFVPRDFGIDNDIGSKPGLRMAVTTTLRPAAPDDWYEIAILLGDRPPSRRPV
jgi:hypothetical protein